LTSLLTWLQGVLVLDICTYQEKKLYLLKVLSNILLCVFGRSS